MEERLNVDEKLKELNTLLNTFNKNEYSSEFLENLNLSLKKIEDLNNTRNGVNSLSLNAGIAIGYYTDLNKLLLNVYYLTKINPNTIFVN